MVGIMKRAQTASMIQVNSKISHLLLHTFCDLLIVTSILKFWLYQQLLCTLSSYKLNAIVELMARSRQLQVQLINTEASTLSKQPRSMHSHGYQFYSRVQEHRTCGHGFNHGIMSTSIEFRYLSTHTCIVIIICPARDKQQTYHRILLD